MCVRTGSGAMAMSASTDVSPGMHQRPARVAGASGFSPHSGTPPAKKRCDAFHGPSSKPEVAEAGTAVVADAAAGLAGTLGTVTPGNIARSNTDRARSDPTVEPVVTARVIEASGSSEPATARKERPRPALRTRGAERHKPQARWRQCQDVRWATALPA